MNEELDYLIDAYLAGEISETEVEKLSNLLRNDEQARTLFIQAADLHANLAVDESLWIQPTEIATTITTRKNRFTWQIGALAAGLIALLSLVLLQNQKTIDTTFATMTHTSSAFWGSGSLPTSDGSRLGAGTLRLADGLATLKFDSGAEVTIEAPATLVLIDEMNCRLKRGTVVSDIPESALGFRIKTPKADVVDYGTRFAVSVFEDTGETLTQVMEGKVQVEYANSDKIVELRTGQRDRVIDPSKKQTSGKDDHEYRTMPVETIDHGPEWTLLETAKDAYTGNAKGHESETLLQLKNPINGGRLTRISWLGFDLNTIDKDRIVEAELLLQFAPTGWGLASYVPDATFGVYGLIGDIPEWNESIQYGKFPLETPDVIHLGSFEIPQGVQKGRFRIRTEALARFLRQHSESEITIKVVRETIETTNGGLVHGFASRRHPWLPAPILAVRSSSVNSEQ